MWTGKGKSVGTTEKSALKLLMPCNTDTSGHTKWLISNACRGIFSCVGAFTLANRIVAAMHERSLVSVKVESRSTSRLSSALFIFPLFYLRD